MKGRVLVVDDDTALAEMIGIVLRSEGFDPVFCEDGDEALGVFRATQPDLVLLDLMLPDGSGYDVCRELRATSAVPIIVLSARGDEADRVVGLELGADDYVVKPFSARELIARIRAVLRRAGAPARPAEGPLEVGGVRLDPARRAVTVDDEPVELSRKEFDPPALPLGEAGTVVPRERLIDEVWDVNWFGSTKTLDVHVSGLRRKLGDDAAEPRYIHTVRGVGFRFSGRDEV